MASKARKSRGNSHLYTNFTGASAIVEGDRISEVKTSGLDTSTGTIDATNWDSGDWQEVIPDINSGTIPMTGNLVLDNAKVPLIIAANGKEPVKYFLVFGDKPAAGAKNLVVSGLARIMNLKLTPGDMHEISYDYVLDGTPTFEYNVTAFPV
ncbi:hypothetical protein [Deinococcus peraridilitoris]|uniref:Uncharacterized protein n=1 Tax=Deinococcus peraridilitoris (strain DSM 19664 / LMG 22246 / CIP 109416 / KR-200) TaxID=937777 RepID=K9ZWW4_DEIPD|nr:hypothetical protein [Deinococcus peraridilitoris]AFZ66066.1 hypothetical protein Deipe_0470 [Deinococcus peraridilitoris DSM 19664]